jgi:hypothetical protein
MNLREFCKIPDFPLAVLTTFNIDPLFFERVVLYDLLAGGATRIFVLADADQATSQIISAQGQLVTLGRRYRLIPVRIKGSFHPKLCVRVGRKHALVASGSHNLTRSGWLGRSSQDQSGGNREATVAWQVGAGTTRAVELYENLSAMFSLIESLEDRDELRAQIESTWLGGEQNTATGNSDPSWGVFGVKSSLASALEERWQGRRFKRLRMVTGSTDQQGAVIRWAAKTFGVKEAVVEIDQAFCSFDPTALSDLAVDLKIRTYDGHPRTHLKVAVFESETESAAVVGSANCSGSAWLRTSAEGGNIESVVIYDHCVKEDLAHMFRHDQATAAPWQDVVLLPPQAPPDQPSEKLQLRQLQLQSSVGVFTAYMLKCPGTAAVLTLIVGSTRFALEPTQDSKVWRASAVDFKSGPETLFGHIEIRDGGSVEITNATWIDDVDRLAEVAGRRLPFPALGRLSSKMISEDYKRLLDDLQVLSKALLTQPAEFPDPPLAAHKKAQSSAAPKRAGQVTVADVILSIDRLKSHGTGSLTSIPLGGVSLIGIMHVLFGEQTQTTDVDPTEAEHGNPPMDGSVDEGDNSRPAPTHKTNDGIEAGPTLAQRQKLLKQLADFKEQLSALSFAQTCTARQLQQAAAYPLGVALLASRGPWIQLEDRLALAAIIRGICEVLFCCGKREIDKETGKEWTRPALFVEVRKRYESLGKGEEFDQIIGDGTLWILVLSSLASLNESPESRFARNMAFCDVARFGVLSSNFNPEYLTPLVRRLSLSVSIDFPEKIKGLLAAMAALDGYIATHFDEWQSTVSSSGQVGDWLWRPTLGYVQIVKAVDPDKAEIHIRQRAQNLLVKRPFYVNLQNACREHATLRTLLAAATE